MSQLDASDCDRGVVEGFEPQHRRTAPVDRAVVLLDDVAGSDFHVAPDSMLAPQSPQRTPTRHVSVEANLARTAWMRSECLAEERLGGGDAAVGSQQEVDRLALLVDGAVQIVPAASN